MNSNQNSKAKQVYRIYACSLALTIIHELGHLFVTYLSHGKVDTPNEMKTPRGHDMPEAGFFLEIVMFGGRVGISRHAKDHADTVRSGLLLLPRYLACKLMTALVRGSVHS